MKTTPMLSRKLASISLLIAAGAVLGACSLLEPVRTYAGKGAAQAVTAECSLSPEQRLKNLGSINNELMAMNSPARAVSLDCDGDGTPDLL